MIHSILCGSKLTVKFLIISVLFVEIAYSQPSLSQTERLSLFDLVDEWNSEIRGEIFNDSEQRIDSLLTTVTQKEDSFHICYTLGRAYAAIKEYELGLKYIQLAEKLEEKGTSEKSIIHYIKGLITDEHGRYEAAITHYETCIQNYDEIPEHQRIDHIIVGLALQFSANNYERLNDYQRGYLNLKKGLKIAEEHHLIGNQKKCLTDLGNVEDLLGNTDAAIDFYQRARALYGDDDPWDGVYALATLGLGTIYVEKKQSTDAEPYLKETVEVLEELIHYAKLDGAIQDQKRFESYLTGAYDTYGLLFLQKNQLADALHAIQKAIKLGKQTYQRPFSRELSRMYVHQADCYVQLEEYEKALEACQAAYKGILPDMDISQALPDPSHFYPESVLLEALTMQADCYRARFDLKAQPDDLQKATACYRLANLAAHQLRTGIGYESGKLLLTDETHQRAEHALEAAFELYQQNPTEEHWQLGFDFAERSKANLLMEALQDRQARLQVGLPDSLLEREKGLQRNLIDAELAFRELKLSEPPQRSDLKQAEDDLYHARRQYDLLEEALEEDFPNYYRLKYASETPTMVQLRSSLLQEGEAIIEFFMGDDFLYIFMLTKEESHFIRKPSGKSLSHLIQETLTSLVSLKDAERNTYASKAHQLYNEILGSLSLEPYKRLTFIPDRELALIPFEALLTSALDGSVSQSNYPYLIKEYICSYAYSCNLLFHTYTRERAGKTAKGTFLGLAPGTFPGSKLPPLPHTPEEVKRLRSRLGGLALTGKEAQKDELLSLSSDFQILHLSTHAMAWDEESQTAWIALSQGEGETIKVRLKELAGLRLNADITILSACETGAGHIQRGEGVMSLARAFTFAGSQATLQSLWPVRPVAAAPLMDAFYEGLIAGKDKATALHDAKLLLLTSETPALHAPIMWAAFAAIGDMRPVELQPVLGLGTWGWLGAVGGMLAFMVAFVLWKRRGKS